MRVLAAALVAIAACRTAPAPLPAASATVPVDAGAPDAGAGPAAPAPSLSERAQAAWEERGGDPAALDRAIALWEEAALSEPHPATLLSAARARRARMERVVQTDPDASRAASADAGACAADAHRSWTAQFPAADGASAQFVQVESPGAEALYLEALCTASWARMQGFTHLIERRGDLLAALTRVAELSPALDGAGAERELGALLCALPANDGGDLREARRHLDAAIRLAPEEPRNHLVLARTVAVKSQDRALFESELGSALKSADQVTAAQAAALLQRADDLFGPAQAAQPTPGGVQK
jgi:hypothetical protein